MNDSRIASGLLGGVVALVTIIAMMALGATGLLTVSLGAAIIIGVLSSGVALGFGVFLFHGWSRQITALVEHVESGRLNDDIAKELWPSSLQLVHAHCKALENTSNELVSLCTELRNLKVCYHLVETELKHLEGVIHSLHDAVIVTNSYDELILANDAAANLFKMSREENQRQNIKEIMGETPLCDSIQDAARSELIAPRRMPEYTLGEGEEQACYDVTMSCVEVDDQSRTNVVTILHDITKERQISQMKTEFVSKASHELRTPLSSIRAYIEMLIDGEAQDDSSRQEFYEIIQTEADRLGRLVDNMLDISRIEAGLIQVTRENHNLVSLAEEVVELLIPQAAEKKITLSTKASIQSCVAEVDHDMIQQVITNLISNAIKYTPDGGRVNISTELTDCDRSVIVKVSDTGLGIPAESIPKLFEKFYRIGSYEHVAKGTGLGLNLVKQIVEVVHHGEVGVESEMGQGTTFWFIVPCTIS